MPIKRETAERLASVLQEASEQITLNELKRLRTVVFDIFAAIENGKLLGADKWENA